MCASQAQRGRGKFKFAQNNYVTSKNITCCLIPLQADGHKHRVCAANSQRSAALSSVADKYMIIDVFVLFLI